MNLKKFVSRKFLATAACVALVVVCDLLGVPLDQGSLDAITSLALGLLGAQGLVDTVAAYKTGTAAATTIEAAKELKDSKE